MTYRSSQVKRCRTCRQFYWRYRRDAPPPGYCSLNCRAGIKPLTREEEAALNVLLEIHAHRLKAHQGSSALEWFADCQECQALEIRQANAVSREVFASGMSEVPPKARKAAS
jgi:hypothetical protein